MTNRQNIKKIKIIAFLLLIPVFITLIIEIIEPEIQFPSNAFNRFWSYLMVSFILGFYYVQFRILKKVSKYIRWTTIISSIIIFPITIYILLYLILRLEYEPHSDRYIVYKNLNKSNEFVVVQDYVNWKHNRPSVDTTLINDYFFLRREEHLDSMKLEGKWLKLNNDGKIIDTISVK